MCYNMWLFIYYCTMVYTSFHCQCAVACHVSWPWNTSHSDVCQHCLHNYYYYYYLFTSKIVVTIAYIPGIFRGGGWPVNFLWIWKFLQVHGKNFVVTCTCALMSVARCIYGNCFVGKYFVVCFSTTKILPPPPPKNTRYTVYTGDDQRCCYMKGLNIEHTVCHVTGSMPWFTLHMSEVASHPADLELTLLSSAFGNTSMHIIYIYNMHIIYIYI